MAKLTEIPGLSGTAFSREGAHPSFPGLANDVKNERAIMGFLFSVSKTSYGEFWPVYVGSNTIGRGIDKDVNLKEKSVSANHAEIVVRQMMKNGEKSGILVFVRDMGSTYGTQVNGDTLGLDPCECKNRDIITIGNVYELLFVHIDAESLGLKPNKDFKSSEISQVSLPPRGFPEGDKGGTVGMSNQEGQNFKGSRQSTVYMPEASVPKF